MDYDDNELKGQNSQIGGEGVSKISPVSHPYALPKFDFNDGLQGHLRFDSLLKNENFPAIPSHEENQWIEDFSQGSGDLVFSSSSAPESCPILGNNNAWSEAASSESVEMLLKSVGLEVPDVSICSCTTLNESKGEESSVKSSDSADKGARQSDSAIFAFVITCKKKTAEVHRALLPVVLGIVLASNGVAGQSAGEIEEEETSFYAVPWYYIFLEMPIPIALLVFYFLGIGFCMYCIIIWSNRPRAAERAEIAQGLEEGLVPDMTPAITQILESVPILSFSDIGEDRNTRCPICLEDFTQGDRIVSLPECNHLFRFGCIRHFWLFGKRATCPICRRNYLTIA